MKNAKVGMYNFDVLLNVGYKLRNPINIFYRINYISTICKPKKYLDLSQKSYIGNYKIGYFKYAFIDCFFQRHKIIYAINKASYTKKINKHIVKTALQSIKKQLILFWFFQNINEDD